VLAKRNTSKTFYVDALRQYLDLDFFSKNNGLPNALNLCWQIWKQLRVGALRQYLDLDFFSKNNGLPNAPYLICVGELGNN
jgi:hypothetical protein